MVEEWPSGLENMHRRVKAPPERLEIEEKLLWKYEKPATSDSTHYQIIFFNY